MSMNDRSTPKERKAAVKREVTRSRLHAKATSGALDGPGGASWRELPASAWDYLAELLDDNFALVLGKTRDGGVLSVTLLDEGEKEKVYGHPAELEDGLRDRLKALGYKTPSEREGGA